MRKRQKRRRRGPQARVPVANPVGADQIWAMDLLQDALSNGRKVRTLLIEDAFTCEMLHPSDEDLSQGTPGWP